MEIGLDPTELERYRWEGRMAPVPVRTQGIVDTAAENTCITESIVDRLLLEPLGRAMMHTAAGERQTAIYYVTLRLGWKQDRPPDPIPVRAYSVEVTGADVLVGLDVLRQGALVLNGPGARFELFLPRGARTAG